MRISAVQADNIEYFSLNEDSLSDLSRRNVVHCIWTNVPNIGVRFITLIPPQSYCWGMQYIYPTRGEEWVENKIVDSRTSRYLSDNFEEIGVDSRYIPKTLTVCDHFGPNRELIIGNKCSDLPRAFFRSVLIDNDQSIFDKFLRRLERHICELNKYFLMPCPDGPLEKQIIWTDSISNKLEMAFGIEHDKRKISFDKYTGKMELLKVMLDSYSEEDAYSLLTPKFLEWDMVRFLYPIEQISLKQSFTKQQQEIFEMLGMRSLDEIIIENSIISILQAKLVGKWKWPLGVKRISKFIEAQNHTFADRESELHNYKVFKYEVDKLLDQSRSLYPLLFS